ncbi:hypothetical protein ONE63_009938 [Megalurothrips usitatus]|uniref:DNA 3'-5' helicase n=1 Tax=Megalurothrips usitatus TaxID=439358 RepID=A0AAV7XKC9_9NEOP|nr:hypothetical protein ONE63_009938 [Megalurothrips usitatus]
MDNLSDPALKQKYYKSKFRVKSWESEFRKKTGNIPSKDDIKEAPCEIREAYKWYWQIKIHSIGQDSMLDATFSDQRKSEPTTNVADATEKNDLLSMNNEVHHTSTSFNKHHLADFPESKCALPVKCIETPVAEQSPSDKERTFEKDTPSADLPKSVWGSHLNKPADDDSNSKKKNLNRSSSSFHLSEKLFVGAKFKKRNPRKSFSSFSAGRSKERSSLVSSDSLAAPSDSSFSVDSSQGVDDGFPVSEFENAISSQNDISTKTHEFKMVKKMGPSSMQPVSAIQKIMEDDLRPTKPKVERSLDKGWLDRVMQADEILSQEVKKNFSPGVPEPSNFDSKTNQSVAFEDSDDDIIYGSDNESKSPRKVEKEERARLALRSTSFTEAALTVSKSEGNINAPITSEKSEANGRKRKLDAIEQAMAVLSERRKNDKSLSQPNKKAKRSDSSKPETRAQTKKSVRLNKDDDSCHDIEVDENLKTPDQSNPTKVSKSGSSKQDVLEKRVASGTVNDNFVRINIQKKVFVRGKKTMNFQKYKKQQWKNKKKELSQQASAYMSRMDPSDSAAGGGLQKCFQCGDVGHFARQCTKMKGDTLMPYSAEDEEEESPFPSLAEVEKMANEKRESVHSRTRTKQEENSPAAEQKSPSAPVKNVTDKEEFESHDFIQENIINDCEEDADDIDIMKEPVIESERQFASVGPLYPLKSDGSMQSTPSEVYEVLRKFGHQSFRPGQEVAIMRILSGLSTLVTLSTGSGKSLCYQLPAYLYATKRNCITLIVSPLVSLMDDQISGLPSFINGAALHTAQTEKQREKVMDMAKAGKLHFLLVSPEAVVAGERKTGFGSLLRELPNIAFACIDEAHCVSQWSHNFRPSYLVIFKVLRDKLGVKTVLGLTATATQTAVSSIIEHMEIPDGRNGVIQDTPLPNNLLLTVSKDSNRDQALMKLLESPEFSDFKSIIVYCIRREECERLATLLRTCFKINTENSTTKRKISAVSEAYHAGLSAARRKQVQTAFMSGDLRIVVATVAFGMGINKADIRSVVHFNMPRNFESYVQEVGRAGRDGLASRCHLFLNSEGKDLNELRRHIFADSVDRHSIRKLLQRVFVPCKCGGSSDGQNLESTPSDEQSNEMKETGSVDKDQKENIQVCVGHEVAFSVEETVAALDLPEENITTLLCYLELRDRNLLQILPKAYTKCRIQSYKGMKHIREVARSCPPLAMAIAMDQISEKSEKNRHYMEFAVVEIASSIGWDSGIVKRELMNLEWTKANGNSRRSGIKVEFFELGFRLRAPGNLSPEKLDAALDFLHERVLKQEHAALSQLQTIFSAVTRVSYPSVTAMMGSDISDLDTHSNDLKAVVRAYFQEDALITADLKSEEKLEHGEQIANDIRQIVSMYRDCSFTGRAVARIFHGIGSPNFPPQVWGRCRFWRAHLESDFKLICLLATRVLLKMR